MKSLVTMVSFPGISLQRVLSEIKRAKYWPQKDQENQTAQTPRPLQKIEVAFASDSDGWDAKILIETKPIGDGPVVT